MKKKSQQTQLLEWCNLRGFFSTSDVIKYGMQSFHNRADRDKRVLCEKKLIIKLSAEDLDRLGIHSKQSYYMSLPRYKYFKENIIPL